MDAMTECLITQALAPESTIALTIPIPGIVTSTMGRLVGISRALTAGLVRPCRFPNDSFRDILFSYDQVAYIENTNVLCQWCPSVAPSGSDTVGIAEFYPSVSLAPTILAFELQFELRVPILVLPYADADRVDFGRSQLELQADRLPCQFLESENELNRKAKLGEEKY
jgi:hypothetical protein